MSMKYQHHLRPGAAWALLLGVLLLVTVTAFTAGRAFNSSSNSSYGAPRPPNMELSDAKFAYLWQKASESSSWSEIGSDRLHAVKYANSSVTEHPACAFFRQGEMRCAIVVEVSFKDLALTDCD
jgi:hypothetical protein